MLFFKFNGTLNVFYIVFMKILQHRELSSSRGKNGLVCHNQVRRESRDLICGARPIFSILVLKTRNLIPKTLNLVLKRSNCFKKLPFQYQKRSFLFQKL